MKKRRMTAILILTLLAAVLSGCGSKKDGGLYEQVKSNGVLRAAVVQDNAPYSWYDVDTKTYSGIEIEILKEVAAALGVSLEYYPTAKAELNEAVRTGEADVAIGRLNAADISTSQVDVSTHYQTGFLYVVTLRGDFSSMLSAFDGEPIGISNKLSEGAGVELYTIEDVEQTYYDTADTVEQDLLLGGITGYFCYEEEARALLASTNLQVQTVIDYEPEKYCITVQQNNPVMIESINEVIQEITESGRLAEVILQYQ